MDEGKINVCVVELIHAIFGCVNMQNIIPREYNARASWGNSFECLHLFSFFKFLSSSVFSKSPVLPLICITL